MTKITIAQDTNGNKIMPRDSINFRVGVELDSGDIFSSNLLNVRFPAYPKHIEKINVGLDSSSLVRQENEIQTNQIKSYSCTRVSKNYKVLRLGLNTAATKLVANNTITITASASSPLNPINGQSFRVITLGPSKLVLTIHIPNSAAINVGTGGAINVNQNSISSTSTNLVTDKVYRVFFPDDYNKTFAYQSPPNSNFGIRDFAVVTYRQANLLTPNTPRKLFNDTDWQENIPYSTIESLYTIRSGNNKDEVPNSFVKLFNPTNGRNIDFWVAVVRYLKVDGQWQYKEWLHKDKDGGIFWKKAEVANRGT